MARSPYDSLFTRLVANTAEPENDRACWLWQGQRDHWWYGRLNIWVPGLGRSVKVMSHLALWLCIHASPANADEFWLAYIELAASGLELDHLCEMPHCCNPDHLEPVTPSENCKQREARRFSMR